MPTPEADIVGSMKEFVQEVGKLVENIDHRALTPAQAAQLYPRNLNAGLTVALAAAPAPVTVRVIADPTVSLNTHEIEAESTLGMAFMRFANRPSPDNPKTSALTAASLAAAVRRLLEPVVR